jgi:predicted GH43/DUF377 family glycosyl hydrolase
MGKTTVSILGILVLLVPCVAIAQTEWVEIDDDVVIPPAGGGAWDYHNRTLDCIIVVDGTYHMYYHANNTDNILGDFEIGHATSADGVIWELDPANPVVTRGAADTWDDYSVHAPVVIHDGSEFRMWYSGDDGDTNPVGYATSPDGSTWTKHQSNPIMDVGPQGNFDDLGVWPGTLIFDGDVYRMWYTGEKDLVADYDWRIGYAESEDGFSWTRRSEPVLDPGHGWDGNLVYFPKVIVEGATHHMWYVGHSGSALRIGYAVSSDGVQWTRYLGNPVVKGVSHAVMPADVDGGFDMWYRGEGAWRLASSTCCSTVFTSFIPAAAYTEGLEGSLYTTDVDVSNAGTTTAEYRFIWLPRGEHNGEWIYSEFFTLGAGMCVRYTNVLEEVFGLEMGAVGALGIESSGPELLAVARIANHATDGETGTFGQAMPAITQDEFIESGDRRRIMFGTESEAMRTNIGCQNMTTHTTILKFELLAADGSSLGFEYMSLQPWSNDQMNRIFREHAPITGAVDVWVPTDGRAFYCYGSVLDNVTNDPTTILPQ